jgi:hypothetical protein
MNEEEAFIMLLAEGGIKFMGYDETTNEKMYVFTPKIKELMPDLYQEHLKLVNAEVMNLWEKGFLNLDLFAPDPLISLTDNAFLPEELFKLSSEELWSLHEIKRVLSDRNI